MKSRVILLNGAGSAGKTSIAKALQKIAADVYLHVQMDAFLDMLPDSHQDHPDVFSYTEMNDADNNREIQIKSGHIGQAVMRGMRHAIGAMADQGNNLIVDEVLTGREDLECAEILRGSEVFFVGVLAPLDVLEARERERGDRMIGLARWQFDRVHKGKTYDLEIDTSTMSPMRCAELIKQKFKL